MGPNSDAVIWEKADPAPRLVSGKPDVRLVKFIVPNGSIRDIEPSPAVFGQDSATLPNGSPPIGVASKPSPEVGVVVYSTGVAAKTDAEIPFVLEIKNLGNEVLGFSPSVIFQVIEAAKEESPESPVSMTPSMFVETDSFVVYIEIMLYGSKGKIVRIFLGLSADGSDYRLKADRNLLSRFDLPAGLVTSGVARVTAIVFKHGKTVATSNSICIPVDNNAKLDNANK